MYQFRWGAGQPEVQVLPQKNSWFYKQKELNKPIFINLECSWLTEPKSLAKYDALWCQKHAQNDFSFYPYNKF